MTLPDSKQRFSTRVADYVRYRPGYPVEVLSLLRSWHGLRPQYTVADIGSGTGILSKLFLEHGNRVYGVEPNADMRAAAETFLAEFPNFASVNGSAEATTLPSDSVDFVVAGQAFHWFDPLLARREFQRILKTGGRAVVLWNERLIEDSAFLREYEVLLHKFGTDYSRVKETYPSAEQMLQFFAPNEFTSHALPNSQEFDFEGLSGRLRSSSFVPLPDSPHFDPMMRELRRIFDAHQRNGIVCMEYRTHIYAGKLDNDENSA